MCLLENTHLICCLMSGVSIFAAFPVWPGGYTRLMAATQTIQGCLRIC